MCLIFIEKWYSYYDYKNEFHPEIKCDLGKFCCGPCEMRSYCFDNYQKLWQQDVCKKIWETEETTQKNNFISDRLS